MTMIEVSIFCVWLVLIVVGALLGRPIGAGPLGALLGLLAGPTLFFGLERLLHAWYWLFPLRPQCARGTCGQGEYRLVEMDRGAWRYLCRCDDEYLQQRDVAGGEDRFERVVDGVVQPYRVRRALRWRPDPRAPRAPFR